MIEAVKNNDFESAKIYIEQQNADVNYVDTIKTVVEYSSSSSVRPKGFFGALIGLITLPGAIIEAVGETVNGKSSTGESTSDGSHIKITTNSALSYVLESESKKKNDFITFLLKNGLNTKYIYYNFIGYSNYKNIDFELLEAIHEFDSKIIHQKFIYDDTVLDDAITSDYTHRDLILWFKEKNVDLKEENRKMLVEKSRNAKILRAFGTEDDLSRIEEAEMI